MKIFFLRFSCLVYEISYTQGKNSALVCICCQHLTIFVNYIFVMNQGYWSNVLLSSCHIKRLWPKNTTSLNYIWETRMRRPCGWTTRHLHNVYVIILFPLMQWYPESCVSFLAYRDTGDCRKYLWCRDQEACCKRVINASRIEFFVVFSIA